MATPTNPGLASMSEPLETSAETPPLPELWPREPMTKTTYEYAQRRLLPAYRIFTTTSFQ
jgi:hypothetical protein